MAGFACPHCGEMVDVFGSGGGRAVADALTRVTGATVPVLGQVPIDPRLRHAGDQGIPLVLSDPDTPAAQQLAAVADRDRKSTRLTSSHLVISYAVFCLKKKKTEQRAGLKRFNFLSSFRAQSGPTADHVLTEYLAPQPS